MKSGGKIKIKYRTELFLELAFDERSSSAARRRSSALEVKE
jgi:hypothetical protein